MVKKYKIIIMLLIIIISLFTFSFSYFTNVNQYIQEQNYLDGYGGREQNRSSSDFILSGCGDESILDTVTGLCWDTNLSRFGSKDWNSAIADCNSLSLGDHSDWRLPDRNEVMTLHNYFHNAGDLCLYLLTLGFTDCISSYYWTGNTYAANTNDAWRVSFNVVSFDGHLDKTFNQDFNCVRNNN